MEVLVVKILGAIILTAIMLFIVFYATIMIALSSSKAMYVIFTLIVILGLITFSNLFIFNQFKKRLPKICFSVFVTGAILFS